jgi:hypothetical protein
MTAPADKITKPPAAPVEDGLAPKPHDSLADAAPAPASVDRLAASSAPGDAGDRPTREGLIDTVTESFNWLSATAVVRLNTLGEHLKKEDPPGWQERLVEGALELALSAGTAGVAEYLAGKLTSEAAHSAFAEGKREFVKVMFEEGIGKGIENGHRVLHGAEHESPIERFMEVQVAGVQGTHNANQKQWIQHGRGAVQSYDDAAALERTCSQENMAAAAERQYEASRDAWVGYLAQTKYGSVSHPSTRGENTEGGTTTDMRMQEARDKSNRWSPGATPADAPSFGDALLGHAPGVLAVLVELPELEAGTMNGAPHVQAAYMNGVNAVIREQYENVSLSKMRIPRHIEARVHGDMPNFEINLDENGLATHLSHAKSEWLRGLAVGSDPQRETLGDLSLQEEGRQKLLEMLVVPEINDKGFR